MAIQRTNSARKISVKNRAGVSAYILQADFIFPSPYLRGRIARGCEASISARVSYRNSLFVAYKVDMADTIITVHDDVINLVILKPAWSNPQSYPANRDCFQSFN
jgi:hypothetical protein